ncbi:cell division protein ZapB [Candidatus Berkiella aquae]|uniref:Uncharacterized protein n=1 Tax=Candidatus Berkiella aquae TaxID=295108 RepID=A0A0Q9YMH9_9GAMM|nr:cell division protein ZapB [Candidatus Berkiella aquae]MCS5709902.1 hypothetical protein [Candidatus Berkiella aquae]
MPTENKPVFFAAWTINSSQDTIQKGEHTIDKSSSTSSHVEGLRNIVLSFNNDIKGMKKRDTLIITDCHLPQDWPNKIITLIERNPEATFVTFPKDLLSSKEQKRLDAILKPRREQVKQELKAKEDQKAIDNERLKQLEQDRASSRNRYLIAGALFGLGISYAIFPVFLSLTTFFVCAAGMGFGFIASMLRTSETPVSQPSTSSTATTVAADAIKATMPPTTSSSYLVNHAKRDNHKNTTDSELESTRQFIAKLR